MKEQPKKEPLLFIDELGKLVPPTPAVGPLKRDPATNLSELRYQGFVLRLYDSEYDGWVKCIAAMITKYNTLERTANGKAFIWRPTKKNVDPLFRLEGDMRVFIYGISDDDKVKILSQVYTCLNDKMNWPNYVEACFIQMLCTHDRTPIKSPFKFMQWIIRHPDVLIQAKTRGR